MVELFATVEKPDVPKPDNVGSLLLRLLYLEVLTGLHCKEDSKCDKLGGCAFEFRGVSLVDGGHDRHGDCCLVFLWWVEIFERPKFSL